MTPCKVLDRLHAWVLKTLISSFSNMLGFSIHLFLIINVLPYKDLVSIKSHSCKYGQAIVIFPINKKKRQKINDSSYYLKKIIRPIYFSVECYGISLLKFQREKLTFLCPLLSASKNTLIISVGFFNFSKEAFRNIEEFNLQIRQVFIFLKTFYGHFLLT